MFYSPYFLFKQNPLPGIGAVFTAGVGFRYFLRVEDFEHFRDFGRDPVRIPRVGNQDLVEIKLPIKAFGLSVGIADEEVGGGGDVEPHLGEKVSIEIHLDFVAFMVDITEVAPGLQYFVVCLGFVVGDHQFPISGILPDVIDAAAEDDVRVLKSAGEASLEGVSPVVQVFMLEGHQVVQTGFLKDSVGDLPFPTFIKFFF